MVREGFKQTEVGVIPENWEVCSLQSLTQKSAPITYGVLKPGDYVHEGVPLLQIKDVIHGDIKIGELHRIGKQLDSQYSRTRLSGGEIVVSLVGTIGRIAYIPASLAGANLHRNLAKVAISKEHESKLIFYQLASERVQSAIKLTTFGSTQSLFNLGDLRSLLMIVPPPSEQQSIAQALSDVDALIAALEKAIAKKRAIKTATMQQLLTGKKRLPGFGKGKGYQQTEVGVIPEDWEVSPLGEVTEYIKGFAFKSSDFQAHGVRVIRVSDTTFDFIKNDSEIFIDERKAKNFRRWALREGDLIISTVGSKPPMYDSMVGKATFVDAKNANSLLNQNAVTIRSKDWSREAQVFLHNHLRQPKYIDHIEKIFRGNANQASITLKELFEFSIPTPRDEEEKWAIATVLSDMDAEIAALETRLAKTQSIKQGMMQQLLTGKVRLKIEADMEAEKENG